MQVSHDERGPHLVLSFERVDDVRGLLISLDIGFEEDGQAGAGCAGPVWVVLRLDPHSLQAQGGAVALNKHLERGF